MVTIILTLTDDEMLIDVRGDLAGILGISLNRKKPTTRAGQSQFELVAGGRSKLNLRADDPTQVKLVAGARNQLNLLIFAPDFSAWRYAS